MRFESLLCALVILSELSGAARAEPVRPPEQPVFSSADAGVIARNELLRAIVEKDPWLVRRMLDALERLRGSREGGPIAGIDPQRDPDLASATRTAEGSVEWFELLRRALDEKAAQQTSPQGAGRSAEGSVELFDMMKRAKSAKDKAQ